MSALERVLRGEVSAGVYRWHGRGQAGSTAALAEAHGWRCIWLDGRWIHDKATFLHAWQQAAAFPAYFGHNWDAFEECINDLAWAPAVGYLIVYDRPGFLIAGEPAAWRTALDILRTAAASWAAQQRPFVVLLRRAGVAAASVPWV